MRKIALKKAFLILLLILSIFSKGFTQQIMDRNDVNAFDRLLMNPSSKNLDMAGNIIGAATLLTPAVLLAAPTEEYWKIGIEYAETMVLSIGIEELVKHCVSRARPYMYFEGAPQDEIDNGDWDDSFFSAHTTLAFAAASFTTFLFCQYFPNSPWKAPVIATSYSLAAATAAIRVASGNHFMTDVLCGAAVGSAIGYLVPLLNTLWWSPATPDTYNVALSPMGFSMTYKF